VEGWVFCDACVYDVAHKRMADSWRTARRLSREDALGKDGVINNKEDIKYLEEAIPLFRRRSEVLLLSPTLDATSLQLLSRARCWLDVSSLLFPQPCSAVPVSRPGRPRIPKPLPATSPTAHHITSRLYHQPSLAPANSLIAHLTQAHRKHITSNIGNGFDHQNNNWLTTSKKSLVDLP
jgi:hypothetical protein